MAWEIEELRREVRRLEGGYGDRTSRRHIPTGLAALDAVLPGGGLPAGAVVEVEGPPGWPPWTFAALLVRAVLAAAAEGEEAVLVDVERDIYPPGLAALGLDLTRTVIVRPRGEREAAWALGEALAPRGGGLVALGCAVAVGALGRLGAADLRRMQVAAEAGGGLAILLVGPRRHGGTARALAALRLRVAPLPSTRSGGGEERLEVEVVRCRGGPAGGRVVVEIDRAAIPARLGSML
jgi:hypothetical protein